MKITNSARVEILGPTKAEILRLGVFEYLTEEQEIAFHLPSTEEQITRLTSW